MVLKKTEFDPIYSIKYKAGRPGRKARGQEIKSVKSVLRKRRGAKRGGFFYFFGLIKLVPIIYNYCRYNRS